MPGVTTDQGSTVFDKLSQPGGDLFSLVLGGGKVDDVEPITELRPLQHLRTVDELEPGRGDGAKKRVAGLGRLSINVRVVVWAAGDRVVVMKYGGLVVVGEFQPGHCPDEPGDVHDGVKASGRAEIGGPQIPFCFRDVQRVGQVDVDARAAVAEDLADFFQHLCGPRMGVVVVFEVGAGPEVLAGQVADELAVKSRRSAPTG